jgi:hypothetical protein
MNDAMDAKGAGDDAEERSTVRDARRTGDARVRERACVRERERVRADSTDSTDSTDRYAGAVRCGAVNDVARDAGGCWKKCSSRCETDDGARGAGERRGETSED